MDCTVVIMSVARLIHWVWLIIVISFENCYFLYFSHLNCTEKIKYSYQEDYRFNYFAVYYINFKRPMVNNSADSLQQQSSTSNNYEYIQHLVSSLNLSHHHLLPYAPLITVTCCSSVKRSLNKSNNNKQGGHGSTLLSGSCSDDDEWCTESDSDDDCELLLCRDSNSLF